MLAFAAVATWLTHRGLFTGEYLGEAWGELWGRLFVTQQVTRWLSGEPLAWSDHINAPWGQPFWPVDPLLQVVAVPAIAAFGEPRGWAVLLWALFFSAGLGGFSLSRTVGGSVVESLLAGLMVELCPFLLMNATDSVTEAIAFGPVLWSAVAAIRYVESPTRARLMLFAVSVFATAGCSPYFAVYGLLALVASVPYWPRPHRRDLACLVAAAVVAGAIVALPLVCTETGTGGRLTTAWHGGYRLVPDDLVVSTADGVSPWAHRKILGTDRPMWVRVLARWPGGLAVTLALVIAVLRGRAVPWVRPVAALGLITLLFGPAWPGVSPVQRLLVSLPGTSVLGNDIRLVIIPIGAAVACLAVSLRSTIETAGFAALVLLTALLASPDACIIATPASLPADLLRHVEGPTVVFPDGDPPSWNPDAWPKENLWLLAHSEGSSAYDFGRGGEPLDSGVVVNLALVAGIPVGSQAYERYGGSDDREAHWRVVREAGFHRVLVLRRSLSDEGYGRVHSDLTNRLGPPIDEDAAGAIWAL